MAVQEDFKFLRSILAQVNVNEDTQAKMQSAYISISKALMPKKDEPIEPKKE